MTGRRQTREEPDVMEAVAQELRTAAEQMTTAGPAASAVIQGLRPQAQVALRRALAHPGPSPVSLAATTTGRGQLADALRAAAAHIEHAAHAGSVAAEVDAVLPDRDVFGGTAPGFTLDPRQAALAALVAADRCDIEEEILAELGLGHGLSVDELGEAIDGGAVALRNLRGIVAGDLDAREYVDDGSAIGVGISTEAIRVTVVARLTAEVEHAVTALVGQ